MEELCKDEEMEGLLSIMEGDDLQSVGHIDQLLNKYPNDYRLHFMRGSLLIELKRPIEAHEALSKAVDIEPQFLIARYQLGFFELTSGAVSSALSTWGPLLSLPADNYLRKFVEGLTHLIRDEFDEAINVMRQGINLNQENEPLNNDISLLIKECEKYTHGHSNDTLESNENQSATSLILSQFNINDTKH